MPLRDAAISVLKSLFDAGHEAYFAGGCVRDRLMGLEPTDYDIATSATPAKVKAIFPRVQTVGESFGVMLVRKASHVIQVATFRTEGVYSDNRRPDEVQFSNAEHDAQRRDFTINGLFEDPLTGRIIDYVGGQSDIEAKIIRAIGEPAARIAEDRLRMLRGIRFMARFGFSLDPDTSDAIRRCGDELKGVSRERIGDEVRRMFADGNRAVAAWELQYHGLDSAVLLEAGQNVAPTRLGRLPDEVPLSTSLAAWLLDRHSQHSDDWLSIASRWSAALVLSNDESSGLEKCLASYQILIGEWERLGVALQKRSAAKPEFNQAVQILQATDRQLFVDVRRRVIDLSQTELAPKPLIDGDDLVSLGLQPGRLFGRILDAVYDAQLEGAVLEKSAALAMAKAVAATIQGERS
jgi:tRNA nucleotidyltransferase/poly(A) polymerase